MNKQTLNQCCVVVPNQPGILAKMTQILSREGVNIDCVLTESIGNIAAFRFLLESENGLRKKLESAGFHLVEDQVFCLELPNKPGELYKLAKKLADQEIDVRYLYGTSHGPTTKAVLAVDKPDAAAKIVKEYGASLVSA